MSDRYLGLVNSPIGSAVASRVGLPRPAVLRRYEPGAPLLPGPLLLGSTSGVVPAGLADLLTKAGADVRTGRSEGDGVDETRWAALVLDATDVATPEQLAGVREFFSGRLRQLMPSGRVLVLGRPADGADVTVDASRQAIEGIVRSLAKELQARLDGQPAAARRRARRQRLARVGAALLPLRQVGLRRRPTAAPGRRTGAGPGRLGPPAGRQDRPGHRCGPGYRRGDCRRAGPRRRHRDRGRPARGRRGPGQGGQPDRRRPRCISTSPRPTRPSGCWPTWPRTPTAWTC